MRLIARIEGNHVIEGTLYNKFGGVKWSYFVCNSVCGGTALEVFYKNKSRLEISYNFDFFSKRHINSKIEKDQDGCTIMKESYYDNGTLYQRAFYEGYNFHKIGNPAISQWHSNGLRKSERYYLKGVLNNPIGPALSKWNENGYMLCGKFFSHGNQIHRDVLVRRMEEGFVRGDKINE